MRHRDHFLSVCAVPLLLLEPGELRSEELPLPTTSTLSHTLDDRWGVRTPAQARDDNGWFRDALLPPLPATLPGGGLVLESPVLEDPGGLVGIRRATPENATLKAGRFYFKLGSISGSLLHSDNVNSQATHPEPGTIAAVRLSSIVLYQFTDDLQFAVGGSLLYLPIEGRAGVSGFGIRDPLYSFTAQPIFRSQFSYELRLADWNLRMVDEFRIVSSIPAELGFGFEYDGQSRAGQYVFHDEFAPNDTRNPFILKENIIGGTASRLLPTETRFTLGVSRAHFWYDGESPYTLPRRNDTVYLSLESELERLRFKPFALYRINLYDLSQYSHQQVRAGFRGPLTENISVTADGGYYSAAGHGRQGELWGSGLHHTPGPSTEQSFRFGRYVAEPFGEVEEKLDYAIRHDLSSVVTLKLSGHLSRFVLQDQRGTRGTQRGLDLEGYAAVMPEGGIRLGGGWVRESYDNLTIGGRTSWFARAAIRYRSLEARATFRFMDRHSDQPNLEYREKLVTLTLEKYF